MATFGRDSECVRVGLVLHIEYLPLVECVYAGISLALGFSSSTCSFTSVMSAQHPIPAVDVPLISERV